MQQKLTCCIHFWLSWFHSVILKQGAKHSFVSRHSEEERPQVDGDVGLYPSFFVSFVEAF
jgi:hypothetical protein